MDYPAECGHDAEVTIAIALLLRHHSVRAPKSTPRDQILFPLRTRLSPSRPSDVHPMSIPPSDELTTDYNPHTSDASSTSSCSLLRS
jgi:hypothetical protein